MLLLHDLRVMHWAVAGVAIGAITLILLYATNRRLGISTGFESACALVSRQPYFRRSELVGRGRWRLPFLAGLVAGGALSALLGGGLSPQWELGRFDALVGTSPLMKSAWMFAGGLLIGFGTRLAGGCTSGHGIFGLSNFEKASWVSTVSFMAAGVLTTQLVYRVIFQP
jgi:uncharacterized membrane protein YedE/YeeE